jgi:outer membrane protein TolC
MKRMTTTRYPAGSRLTPLFALLALLVGATAVPAEAIDLETAVALALQSNLGIDSELAAVRQKKLIADTWWNRFYPSANANYTLGRLNVEPTSAVPGVPASPQWFMSAGVDLNLVLTLQMIPGISLSRLDYENGLIGLAEARAQVERDVSRQFYQLLLLQDRIELQRQQIANAERRYSQAQSNYDNGLIDEYTLLSSRVSLENLRPALAGLEVGYQQALLGFRNSLGLPLTAEVTPIGEIDPPEINLAASAVTQQHLRGRFDIQQLEMLDRILREQRRVTDFNPQGGRAPYFRFGWSVDPTFQGDPLEGEWLDFDRWEQRSGAFTVSVVQPLDGWLPFSQTRNQISEFDTQIYQNQLSIEQALRGAEINVRVLLLQIDSGRQALAALEQNVDLARRAYELAEVGYNNGLRDLLEVQTAELELRNAELNLLEEKKNIMDSVLELEYALNATLAEIREMQE